MTHLTMTRFSMAALMLFLGVGGMVRAEGTGGSSAPAEAPAHPTDAGDDEDSAPKPDLDQSVVQDVIFSHMPAIRHCYNRELRKDPELAGVVKVKFTVGTQGKVTDAAIKESSLKNKDVESCIVGEVKTWVFPEPRSGKPVDITYPFKFKPST